MRDDRKIITRQCLISRIEIHLSIALSTGIVSSEQVWSQIQNSVRELHYGHCDISVTNAYADEDGIVVVFLMIWIK